MDVQCTQAFLQEMRVKAPTMTDGIQDVQSFLVCFHRVPRHQLQTLFVAIPDHFKGGGNVAELAWFGKRTIPGFWVGEAVAEIQTFIAIIQLSRPAQSVNVITRIVSTWLRDLKTPPELLASILGSIRCLTTCECEHLSMRVESPVEVDPATVGNMEQLLQIWPGGTKEECEKLRSLMGEVEEWLKMSDLPDDIVDLPMCELCEKVIETTSPEGCLQLTSMETPMLLDGRGPVEYRQVAICDATDSATDSVVDSATGANEFVGDLVENIRKRRRVLEPLGYVFFTPTPSGEIPVFQTRGPKKRLTPDEHAKIWAHAYLRKHGHSESPSLSVVAALTRLAVCYRELVDAGRFAQRDRVSQIIPILEMTYRHVFNKTAKFSSLSSDSKQEIQRITMKNRCGGCGECFAPP